MTPGECPICDRDLGLADEDEHFSCCLDKKITEAVAKERERCAKIATNWSGRDGSYRDGEHIAEAIRGSHE